MPEGVVCNMQMAVPKSLLDKVLKAFTLNTGPLPAPAEHSTQLFSDKIRLAFTLIVPEPKTTENKFFAPNHNLPRLKLQIAFIAGLAGPE